MDDSLCMRTGSEPGRDPALLRSQSFSSVFLPNPRNAHPCEPITVNSAVQFKDFKEAWKFMDQIAVKAEEVSPYLRTISFLSG